MRNKLKRFAENKLRDNLVEPGKEIYEQVKGNWNTAVFENENPITVELACGRGEYSVGLAEHFPERNFIGVDIKGSRLWYGSREAEEKDLDNVAFLRTRIHTIENFFEPDEIDEIWITFPDPRPRDRDEKRRLTHPRFLSIYQNLLKEGGTMHLKTDDRPLFDFTLEMIQQFPIEQLEFTHDLYDSELLPDHRGIQTRYERMFLSEGKKINYLRFNLKKQ